MNIFIGCSAKNTYLIEHDQTIYDMLSMKLMEQEGKIKFQPAKQLVDKQSKKVKLTPEEREIEIEKTRQSLESAGIPLIGPYRRKELNG